MPEAPEEHTKCCKDDGRLDDRHPAQHEGELRVGAQVSGRLPGPGCKNDRCDATRNEEKPPRGDRERTIRRSRLQGACRHRFDDVQWHELLLEHNGAERLARLGRFVPQVCVLVTALASAVELFSERAGRWPNSGRELDAHLTRVGHTLRIDRT
jgi:hypothetical protein